MLLALCALRPLIARELSDPGSVVSKELRLITRALPYPAYSACLWGKREPTRGLEPLACSLRVIIQALQALAGVCKSRISKRFSLLRFAACCTVLRSRWCQSGVNRGA